MLGTDANTKTAWISAGAARRPTVTFDPQTHAGTAGQFVRFIYPHTNDPAIPEMEVQIKANVIENPVSQKVSQ